MNLFGWNPLSSLGEAQASPECDDDDEDINGIMYQLLSDLTHGGDIIVARVTEFSSTMQEASDLGRASDFHNTH